MSGDQVVFEPVSSRGIVSDPSANLHSSDPILFYDGECGLCDRSVKFILKHDRQARFRFAPLQGETFERYADGLNLPNKLSSMVLVDEQGRHIRSEAVRRTCLGLGGAWKIAAALLWIIPRPFRDLGYRFVAAVRYKIFGRVNRVCALLSREQRQRFLP